MAAGWSRQEVEATVADYVDMLMAELRSEPYSKAGHRRRLQPLLRGRTESAIELKHGNISAVLIRLGFPYINGYKPYWNYQALLQEVVAAQVTAGWTPFFVSQNEVHISERRADQYHLYRLFDFRDGPRLFTLAGALPTRCELDPTQFRASIHRTD